jgi:hypothetical protein
MKNETRMLMLSAALAAFMLPAAAQTSGTTPNPSQPPVQNQMSPSQRAENQQDRISRGIADGQLTPGEAGKLESDEAKINREAARMKAANGGKLTAADRAKLQRQQNYMSHQIYKDAHNSNVVNQNPKSEVGKRMENQQDRIAQGVNSGQLTAGEAANLEKKDAAIGREVQHDRAANGGTLTQAERQQVNRQENRVSKQIYRDKHNNRRARR